jgi:hypothetical protein
VGKSLYLKVLAEDALRNFHLVEGDCDIRIEADDRFGLSINAKITDDPVADRLPEQREDSVNEA